MIFLKNENIKRKFRITIYILFLFDFLLLISCNKNKPVTIISSSNIYEDTSNVYEWRRINVTGPFGIYAADTGHIYIFYGDDYAYMYDGINPEFQSVNFNDAKFRVNYAGGINNDNVFFVGEEYYNYNYYPPAIKKVRNGSVIASWIIYDDSLGSAGDALVTGTDETWIMQTNSPVIYHLNSGVISRYKLEDSLNFIKMYKDKNADIYAFGYLNSRDSGSFIYAYRFNGQKFDFIRKDSLSYFELDRYFHMFKCGIDMLMRSDIMGLLYFNGVQWTKYMDNPGIAIYNLGGDSKDKMISFAQLIGYPHPSAYIWNGKKWTNEKELERLLMIESGYVDLGFDHMCLCGDYVYIQSMFNDASFLMIGKMKK